MQDSKFLLDTKRQRYIFFHLRRVKKGLRINCVSYSTNFGCPRVIWSAPTIFAERTLVECLSTPDTVCAKHVCWSIFWESESAFFCNLLLVPHCDCSIEWQPDSDQSSSMKKKFTQSGCKLQSCCLCSQTCATGLDICCGIMLQAAASFKCTRLCLFFFSLVWVSGENFLDRSLVQVLFCFCSDWSFCMCSLFSCFTCKTGKEPVHKTDLSSANSANQDLLGNNQRYWFEFWTNSLHRG